MKLILAAPIRTTATATAGADEYGLATYYFNPYHGGLIAAHRTLPFGTRVRVNNLDNGRSTVVTIVDRGPWRPNRTAASDRRRRCARHAPGRGCACEAGEVLGRAAI